MASRRILARHVAERLASENNRSEVIEQLAGYLVAHNMTPQLGMVLADIERNLAQKGVVQARVVTARPLTDELRSYVESYVKNAEAAKTIILNESVETDIIGGIIVETPNKRFDASVASQLKRLKTV